MEDKRMSEKLKNEKTRTSGFIHVGEIIPGVLRDIEKRAKGSLKPVGIIGKSGLENNG